MNSHIAMTRNDESGFTLVELLVVIAIIAILTAIAVPSFLSQRAKANDAAVRSDIKSVVTAIETAAVENSGSVTVSTAAATATVGVGSSFSSSVKLSKGVTIASEAGSTTDHYTLNGSHTGGTGAIQYDNANGGFFSPDSAPVESTPTPTPSPTTPPPVDGRVTELVDGSITNFYPGSDIFESFTAYGSYMQVSANYTDFMTNASWVINNMPSFYNLQIDRMLTADNKTMCIQMKSNIVGSIFNATGRFGSEFSRLVIQEGKCS